MADPRQKGRAAAAPGRVLVVLLGWLVLFALVGVALGVLWAMPGSAWARGGATLTAFVQLYLVDWPNTWGGGNWGWLDWLRPGQGMVPILVAILNWCILIFGFMLPMVMVQIYGLRKILGFMQARVGPTQVGPHGLLQIFADVVKLLTKEDVIPAQADRWVFFIAPVLVLAPSAMSYLVLPFGPQRVEGGALVSSFVAADLNVGLLYLLAISSVSVIGVIGAGWASNNKYALLGGLRSAAQLMTYEVPLSLAVLAPVLWSGSLNLSRIAEDQPTLLQWYCWPNFLGMLIFLVAALAELGHIPFDLPEAESELVAGYHVEYSGMKFGMFFLAEFSNAYVLAAIGVTIFFGGYQSPFPASWPVLGLDYGIFGVLWFFLKTFSMIFALFWVRATLPRVRIDQLMAMGWKFLIPLSLLNLVLVAVLRLLAGG